jgi:hypothetical protein
MPDEAIGDARAWAARCWRMARAAHTEAAARVFLQLGRQFEALAAPKQPAAASTPSPHPSSAHLGQKLIDQVAARSVSTCPQGRDEGFRIDLNPKRSSPNGCHLSQL